MYILKTRWRGGRDYYLRYDFIPIVLKKINVLKKNYESQEWYIHVYTNSKYLRDKVYKIGQNIVKGTALSSTKFNPNGVTLC